MSLNNRLHNCKNPYQGESKRILCVCSAGLLRSPTAAKVLGAEPFNYNTRSAGIREYALIQVDEVLIEWAEEIVVMESWMMHELDHKYKDKLSGKILRCLDINDNYSYMEPDLCSQIVAKYMEE